MKSILSLIVFIGVSYFLWRSFKPDKWMGFYYPDADNLLSYQESYELNSLEECREWVDDISGGRTDKAFDYECGKNCKHNDASNMYVCEETVN